MKYGKVLLIGRPNVGKSTFINNLIGQKVAITSPKPQTTRFPILALFEEERGQILFVDTPGIFGRAENFLAKKIKDFFYISGINKTHVKPLLDKIFEYLPEVDQKEKYKTPVFAGLNIDSRIFIAELIREKV